MIEAGGGGPASLQAVLRPCSVLDELGNGGRLCSEPRASDTCSALTPADGRWPTAPLLLPPPCSDCIELRQDGECEASGYELDREGCPLGGRLGGGGCGRVLVEMETRGLGLLSLPCPSADAPLSRALPGRLAGTLRRVASLVGLCWGEGLCAAEAGENLQKTFCAATHKQEGLRSNPDAPFF